MAETATNPIFATVGAAHGRDRDLASRRVASIRKISPAMQMGVITNTRHQTSAQRIFDDVSLSGIDVVQCP